MGQTEQLIQGEEGREGGLELEREEEREGLN